MVNRARPTTALVLIDLQMGLAGTPVGAEPQPLAALVAERGVLAAAAGALGLSRERSLEIVHVRLAFDAAYANRTNRTARFDDHEAAGRFSSDSDAAQFCREVAPIPGELVLDKGSVSAFASTILERTLRARGVRRLVLGGVATHLAVESAAREAADRGFEVIVLEDVCAAPPALHEHSITQTIPLFAQVVDTSGLGHRLDAVTR